MNGSCAVYPKMFKKVARLYKLLKSPVTLRHPFLWIYQVIDFFAKWWVCVILQVEIYYVQSEPRMAGVSLTPLLYVLLLSEKYNLKKNYMQVNYLNTYIFWKKMLKPVKFIIDIDILRSANVRLFDFIAYNIYNSYIFVIWVW